MIPGGLPPVNLNSNSASKAGDIYASSQFSTGSFGGSGGASQYWPLLLVAAGVLWFVSRKK